MHFHGFLNRKTKEVKHENKGKKEYQDITCYNGWNLDLKWEVESSESASSLKELLEKLLNLWDMKW